ncbi:MAG: sugar ABC transporter ATP-binding protein [Clostridia bacterium]|nr:sugar ABC transporter ATP-binding protein [Clostridia bacterium]
MSEYILDCKGVCKSFGGVHALQNVDLRVKRGEVHCLAGENGCGKSTIIKAISGFQPQDSGTIEFDGTVYQSLSPSVSIDQGIQVIYQDMSVFPNLTVQENLAINTVISNKQKIYNHKQQREIAKKVMATLDLDLDLDDVVETLPVAAKQLIAIARALYAKAKFLILDEPTTALTRKEVDRLFEIIRDLKAKGLSILFVSHKLDEMYEISDSITIMRSGQAVYTGPMATLSEEDFTHYMTGRDFDDVDNKHAEERIQYDAQPAIELKDLSGPGFAGVSFKVQPGEIVGITGQLGSGRSELCNTLFGIEKATGGSITCAGKQVTISSVKDATKNGIALVPEDRLTEGLFLPVSIMENITLVNFDKFTKGVTLDSASQIANSSEWVKDIHVKTDDHLLPVQTLSGGNQQKVVLAKWLSTDPKILILNGPTVGVDIGAKYDIYALLRDLAKKGLAVLVASDDLTEVSRLCDRTVVMRGGLMTGEIAGKDLTVENLTKAIM